MGLSACNTPPSDDPLVPRPATTQVQPGDDVLAIVRRYDVSMPDLIALNGLRPPYALTPGQTLRLPGAPAAGGANAALAGAPVITVPSTGGAPTQIAPGGAPTTVHSTGGGGLAVQPLPPPGQAGAVPPAVPGAVATPGATVPGGAVPTSPTPIVPKPGATPPVPPVASANPPPPAATTPPPVASTQPATRPAAGSSRFAWPVSGPVIAGYNAPVGGKPNQGINIQASSGTPIKAASGGTVAYAGNELRGYGNLVLIQHGDGLVTAYAHAGSLSVKKGDTVSAGQTIGTVGQTGAVDQPQLHFEVRKNSQPVDPSQYLPKG